MTNQQHISTENFEFEFYFYRAGKDYLIAFNGFGENASSLSTLIPYVEKKYSVIAISLPYHGNSKPLEAGKKLSTSDLSELILKLQEKFGFHRFSLFGYSLGAKIALQILELMPGCIWEMILFAPDGIGRNKWYNLTIKFSWSRWLFKQVIENPNRFLKFVSLLRLTGIVSPQLETFLSIHLQTRDKRLQVYHVWFVHQEIVPDIPKIKRLIAGKSIKVRLYFGKKDKIIGPAIGKKFRKGIEQHCELHLLDSGHKLLTDKNLSLIN